MRFLVWDDYHGKVIGLFALGDAVFNLKARDEHVGWDHHRRAEAMVNLMDAYALGAIPPYNMLLGGKLVAALIRTKDVTEAFRQKYKNSVGLISGEKKNPHLVAVTTTSALGRSSIYNRLRLDGVDIFKSIGNTTGWGNFHISDKLVLELRNYLRKMKDPYADAHEYGEGPNFRLRIIKRALGRLGLDPGLARHGLSREVFFCSMANNAIEYLRGEQSMAKYTDLQSAESIATAAMERWVIPRAERMPTFRGWKREMFLAEIAP